MKKIKILTVIAVAAITIATKAEAQKKPPPPPPPPPVPIFANNDAPAKMNEFLKDHPAVKDIYFEKKNLLVVELKNGKTEKYNMADSDENKSFIDKYGEDVSTFIPPPPPPPPPLPKKEAI
jgi:hypothetical protein